MRKNKSDILFDTINTFLLVLILISIAYPVIYVISASISSPEAVNSGRMLLIPKDITLQGYKKVFANSDIWMGYKNTIIYTFFGTVLNVVMTVLCAYPLSRKDFIGRNFFMGIFVFTIFFNGGMIPLYMVIRSLNLLNTMWVMIIPGCMSVTNMIITRTYLQNSIPVELQEAAQIDGCSNTRLFIKIILPLSKPILAIMALYYGVAIWNSYFSAMIYLDDRKLYPLQLILREILVQQEMSTMVAEGMNMETMAQQAHMADLIRYAVIIVSTLPVLLAYPFVQKYFVKGVMIGSVKG